MRGELGYGTTLVINATHALEDWPPAPSATDVVFTDV